jgi:hypothetical protein
MRCTLAAALTACLALVAIPATAGPPSSKPATAGPKTPKTPKTPKITTTSTPKSRPVTAGPKAAAPKAAASVKAPKPVKAPKTPKTAATTSTGTQGAPTTKSAVPKNPKLAARLQAMLPPGMTVEQAALGFKNQGQFIAAVNVANNHGIPFVDLKTSMVDGGLSLGQAIQQLKPSLDGEVEAARAMRLAQQQLEPR